MSYHVTSDSVQSTNFPSYRLLFSTKKLRAEIAFSKMAAEDRPAGRSRQREGGDFADSAHRDRRAGSVLRTRSGTRRARGGRVGGVTPPSARPASAARSTSRPPTTYDLREGGKTRQARRTTTRSFPFASVRAVRHCIVGRICVRAFLKSILILI